MLLSHPKTEYFQTPAYTLTPIVTVINWHMVPVVSCSHFIQCWIILEPCPRLSNISINLTSDVSVEVFFHAQYLFHPQIEEILVLNQG